MVVLVIIIVVVVVVVVNIAEKFEVNEGRDIGQGGDILDIEMEKNRCRRYPVPKSMGFFSGELIN